MAFKRSSSSYGQSPFPETPYQKAGQIWDDRIGSARVQAKNWRLMALGCLGLCFVTSGALVWRSMQSTVTPYVVEVDETGAARAVALPPNATPRPMRRSRITLPTSLSTSGASPSTRSSCARTGCAPMTSSRIAPPPPSTNTPRQRSVCRCRPKVPHGRCRQRGARLRRQFPSPLDREDL